MNRIASGSNVGILVGLWHYYFPLSQGPSTGHSTATTIVCGLRAQLLREIIVVISTLLQYSLNSYQGLQCVCVFFPFILDIKFVGRTSRGHTGFLIHLLSAVRALVFLAKGFSHSFPSSTVRSNFVY